MSTHIFLIDFERSDNLQRYVSEDLAGILKLLNPSSPKLTEFCRLAGAETLLHAWKCTEIGHNGDVVTHT